MKAIETHYKGCRFRSRLEARWAVLFDFLGIRWQFEQEGFEFNNGLRYLPDFWLPDLRMYVEVKGIPPGPTEWNKIWCLRKASGLPVIVVYQPGESCDPGNPHQHGGYTLTGTVPFMAILKRKVTTYDMALYLAGFDMNKRNAAVVAARSARFEFGESGYGQH